jgi:hypothetical protein
MASKIDRLGWEFLAEFHCFFFAFVIRFSVFRVFLCWHDTFFFFLRKTGKRNRAVFFYFLFFFLKTECNIGYKNSRKTSSTNFFFFLLRYQSIKTGIWIGQTTINYKKCHFVSGTSLIIIIFYFFLKKLNFKNKQEKTKMKKKTIRKEKKN